VFTQGVDVDIAPFDLSEHLSEAKTLARTAMTAADQPGGMLIASYLDQVTELDGLLALGAYWREELAGMLLGWPTASRDWWPHHVRPALAMTENEHWLDGAFEIAELHVHPELQGIGVGSALLEEAERRIDNPRMVLSTNAIDNWQAKEFYRRRGFRTLTGPVVWLGLPLRILVLGKELHTS
jgi:ribosomal protein S18 acetylase RimI-like enzyme